MSDWGVGALCFIVFLNTAFVAGLAIGLWMLKRKLDALTQKIDPLADRAGQILGRVEQLTNEVQRRTEKVLDQTAAVVDTVSKKVDTTTALAEETISQPLIGAASLVAGISRGLQTYREQGLEKGDSH